MAKTKNYHHPELKKTLLNAALKELNDKGVRNFSLRNVAARAGVSHTAPYRHFRNREALLLEVTLQGHLEFGKRLLAAAAASDGSPIDRILDLGRAYLDFARTYPDHLALMFSRTGYAIINTPEGQTAVLKALNPAASSWEDLDEEQKAVMDSFTILAKCIGMYQTETHMYIDLPGDAMAVAVWSFIHGFAFLSNEGIIEMMAGERGYDPGRAVEMVLGTLRRFFEGKSKE